VRLKPRVYITSRSFGLYCKEALELVRSVADVEQNPYGRAMTGEELLRAVEGKEGLIVGNERIGREIFERAEGLRIVARHGIGTDNVDLGAATEGGVVVTYTPHANADSVADFTVGLMLSAARRIPQAHNSTRQGLWEATRFMGAEVHGKTLGIIGLGAVGRRVAERARGFGMRVLAFDPYVKPGKVEGVELVDLEALLGSSDVVTVHVPLTEETRGMIGEEEFEVMKRSAYLINTARGEVVDEEALYRALKGGRIAGAALDVYGREPPGAGFPLFELENVIVSPHIASYTWEAVGRMDMMNAEDLARFFRGEKPLYVANPEVLGKVNL